ncbi:hypothetical protein GQ457_11G032530 [Hibiscus cannabinus]
MDKNVISHVYNYGINMSLWIKIFLQFRAASLSTFVVLITLCFLLPYNFQVRELDRFGFWFDSVAQANQVLDKVVHFCLTLRWWHSYVYIV